MYFRFCFIFIAVCLLLASPASPGEAFGGATVSGDDASVSTRHRDPLDIILATTSLLETDAAFDEMVGAYITAAATIAGFDAAYIVLDSQECLDAYGVRVENPYNWRHSRDVLGVICQATGARYVILLGGVYVIPRPNVEIMALDKAVTYVRSDAWYVDFDEDRIVDEGFAVGRMPDLFGHCEGVTSCLATAIELRQDGGATIDNEVRFTSDGYTTPPYGVCGPCGLRAEFLELLSTHDYILFAGHGDPLGFYNDYFEPKFTVSYIDSVDLQSCHPMIIGYNSCDTGIIYSTTPTLSSEFTKAGASAFIARTSTRGVPTHVASNFKDAILGGERVGSALFRLMRETVFVWGDDFKPSAGHLVLYGDPTLKRREIMATHLAYFRSEWDGSRARLSWRVTANRAGTVFQAWRVDPASQQAPIGGQLSAATMEFEVFDPAPPSDGADYRLQEIDAGGRSFWHGPARLPSRRSPPSGPRLDASWPNPFNPQTTLSYALPKAGRVRLSIHDLRGRSVVFLVDGVKAAGEHSAVWDGCRAGGEPASSGVYVVRLETDAGLASRKIMLAK